MRTNSVVGLLLIGIFAALPASAQIIKKAQVGFRFLENPVSADVIGRGTVGVAVPIGSNGVFWNPALVGLISTTLDASLHHTQGIADIDYNAASVGVRLGDVGVVGLSLLAMDYGTFRGTRVANNADGYIETGTFSPSAYAVGIAFSQRISERFSYGVHVKYVSQDLGDAWVARTGASIDDPALEAATRRYERQDFAMDVGAFYDFRYNGIRFGAALQNISREIRYEYRAFPMPFAVTFGATVEPLLFFLDADDEQVLILSFESRHPRDFREKVKIGGEFQLMKMVTFRAGYMANYDERGFTAGAGFRTPIGEVPLRLDYAYQPFGIFGSVHHLTLGVSY
jgi:hypothetical protein